MSRPEAPSQYVLNYQRPGLPPLLSPDLFTSCGLLPLLAPSRTGHRCPPWWKLLSFVSNPGFLRRTPRWDYTKPSRARYLPLPTLRHLPPGHRALRLPPIPSITESQPHQFHETPSSSSKQFNHLRPRRSLQSHTPGLHPWLPSQSPHPQTCSYRCMFLGITKFVQCTHLACAGDDTHPRHNCEPREQHFWRKEEGFRRGKDDVRGFSRPLCDPTQQNDQGPITSTTTTVQVRLSSTSHNLLNPWQST